MEEQYLLEWTDKQTKNKIYILCTTIYIYINQPCWAVNTALS